MVKICGLTSLEDAEYSMSAGADILGVVMSDLSPRKGSARLISDIATGLGADVAGVYTDFDTVIEEAGDETYIQLHFPHGKEQIDYVKGNMGKKVISVLLPGGESDLFHRSAQKLDDGADLVLIDFGADIWSSPPIQPSDIGGMKIGLAGKLSEKNVRQALDLNPYFIDLSSGLEESPGVKSREKIRRFMEVVKAEKTAIQ